MIYFNPPASNPLSFCRLYLTKTKRAKLFVWKLLWPEDSEARLATKLISVFKISHFHQNVFKAAEFMIL